MVWQPAMKTLRINSRLPCRGSGGELDLVTLGQPQGDRVVRFAGQLLVDVRDTDLAA